MLRINPLILIGGIVVLIGVFSPWYNINIPMKLNTTYINAVAHCYISPFSLTINITSTSETTIFEDIEVLDYKIKRFHSVNHSIIGFTCIIGTILGLIGEYANRMSSS